MKDHNTEEHTHYGKLALMAVLSFISMYVLMYAMVNEFANVFMNVNQFYMAALMTSPMLIIEVLLMGMMYRNKKWNGVIIAVSLLALAGTFAAIRYQTGVTDRQFLKSMIPHHSGAILMCDQADLSNPEVRKLCEEIIENQRKEIAEMEAMLDELQK